MKALQLKRRAALARAPKSYVPEQGQATGTLAAGPLSITLPLTEHVAVLTDDRIYECACGVTDDLSGISRHMLDHKPEAEAAKAAAEEASRQSRLAAAESAREFQRGLNARKLERLGRVRRAA